MAVRARVSRTDRAGSPLQVLLRLGRLGSKADPDAACVEAARLLTGELAGFRFALVYLLDSEPARLVAAAGLRRGRLTDPDAWPLLETAQTGAAIRVEAPAGPAVVAPIAGPGPVRGILGALVAGLPFEPAFDEDRVALVQVAAGQIGAAIEGALAYTESVARAEESERLQAQVARTVELEQLKSEFLRLASHELRGPIAVVRGYLDMLVTGTFGVLPAPMDTVMPIVGAKVDEMNRLVEQMLETARLEENRVLLSSSEFDLRQVARESANSLMPLSEITHRFRFNLSPKPILVLADRNRIAGVITNVIENAIKYSPEGGEIVVTCGAVDDKAVITVEDEGIGIDADDLPRLFTRFGRIVNQDNSHIPGTGLGLYLAREIARMHSGEITISSRRGQGTRVVISLPLSSPAAGRPAAAEVETVS